MKACAWTTVNQTQIQYRTRGLSVGIHATICHQYSSRLRDTLLAYQGLTDMILLHVQTSKHLPDVDYRWGRGAAGASGTTGALYPTGRVGT